MRQVVPRPLRDGDERLFRGPLRYRGKRLIRNRCATVWSHPFATGQQPRRLFAAVLVLHLFIAVWA